MLESEELKDLVVSSLEDRKGNDITVLDVKILTDITDYMVIATGRSTRQVSALAENVVLRAKEAGIKPLGTEGMNHGEWALVDLTDVVVHVMNPDNRALYQLEKLWGSQSGDTLSEFMPARAD